MASRSESGLQRALAVALLLGCASAPPEQREARAVTPSRDASMRANGVAAAGAPTTHSAVPGAEATLLVTDSATLAELETLGLGLTRLLANGNAVSTDNRALSALPAFSSVARVLRQEATRAAREDKLAGVDVARFSHRLFDVRFLSSQHARFQLAGVVNRLDRAPFTPGSCGETRLIYRLAYDYPDGRSSKLPMTLAIELSVAEPTRGCREVASRWLEPVAENARARAEWLSSSAGPLAPELRSLSPASARLVVNLQLLRWPSSMRPDLGGHAEYVLRSFRQSPSGVFETEELENTPDSARLKADPNARAELLAWLGSETGAAAIAAGTVQLPRALLAQRSVSVTPRGLARGANRPFSAALSAPELAALAPGAPVRSGNALLRYLDQMSCPGCHQARSVAGFHLLGEDAANVPAENALVSAISAHVLSDLPRRARITRQVLRGETPDLAVPFAERTAPGPAGYGEHCGLGSDATFDAWSCGPGLVCSRIEAGPADPVGQCLPETAGVGDACEQANITALADGRRDRNGPVTLRRCDAGVCNRSAVGFPGGMCTPSCGTPGSTCGAIAILDSFNACLARGEGFLDCTRANQSPAGLRSCDASSPCRDDYVCARGADGGVCLPPYFVFQLRVDGHR